MAFCVDRLQGHSFIASTLRPGSLVIDLGANAGRFAQLITERYGVRCVCFEPNPAMFDLIPASTGIVKRQIAAGARREIIDLYVDENPEASSIILDGRNANRVTVQVEAMPFDQILQAADAANVELMKIDIEGAETEFLTHAPDSDLQRVSQLSLEFHEMQGLTKKDDITRLLDRMRRLGFDYVRMSALHYGDVLFLNRRHFGAGQTSAMVAAAKRYRNYRVFRGTLSRTMSCLKSKP